jgi:hypothetical protein
VEEERFVGLIDERRDVTDVDGLSDVDEFLRVAKPIEELPEVFFHDLPFTKA